MALPFTTVRDLLRFGVSRFTEAGLSFGHGSSNAYDEAAYLILHTLHLPLDTLDPFLDARLLDTEIDAVMKVIERRAKDRVPAAYITHEAWMHGHRFYVDERVIVPRSFIGELLQDGLQPYVADPDQVSHVLELCTGSGCLAILAAQAFQNADIDAVDISAPALEVAHRNVDEYGLDDRIALYEPAVRERHRHGKPPGRIPPRARTRARGRRGRHGRRAADRRRSAQVADRGRRARRGDRQRAGERRGVARRAGSRVAFDQRWRRQRLPDPGGRPAGLTWGPYARAGIIVTASKAPPSVR
jgi:SAM-dependent methyltransferase